MRKYRRHRAKRRDIYHERQRSDAYRRSLQDAYDRAFWADEIYADLSVAQRKRPHPAPKFRVYALHEARLPAGHPRLHEGSLAASRHPGDRARISLRSGKKLEILARGFFSNGCKSAKNPATHNVFAKGARPILTHAKPLNQGKFY